ncbi:hypothetical protein [Phenylobacterium sp.]|uniref:hypothetical protein n=1 Tax=Phenylobacterium sp. TaxID=1871053 RepID=UPI0035683A3C
MLVIGHLDNTVRGALGKTREGHWIRVPDFHKGHLGFLPEIAVRIASPSLSNEDDESIDRTCEMMVTPYIITKDIFRLKCLFVEKRGVVERLVNLMSYLRVNIISLESASLFTERLHTVHLVLDLRRSKLNRGNIGPSDEMKYVDILSSMQTMDRRGLELFLYIVRQCHDILSWDAKDGRDIPNIQISDFAEHDNTNDNEAALTIVKRTNFGGEGPKHTYLKIDPERAVSIATKIGVSEAEEFDYLLLSDTESRNLRVKFLSKTKRQKLFHIGFYHKNEIGALNIITKIVARSNFNVITSLIRRVQDYHNVWEVILEYQGSDARIQSLPKDPRRAIQLMLNPALKQLREAASAYGIALFIPTHIPVHASQTEDGPVRRGWKHSIPLDPDAVAQTPRLQFPRLIRVNGATSSGREWIVDYASAAIEKGPAVFISCPTVAAEYRDALCRRLEAKGWTPTIYSGASKSELTYAEARRLIVAADYFVGIWHPEPESAAADKARRGAKAKGRSAAVAERAATASSVSGAEARSGADAQATPAAGADHETRRQLPLSRLSPWMHFELGEALALHKPFKIIAHKDLNWPEVVRRIAADRTTPGYSDEASFDERITELLVFMENNWRLPMGGRKTA